MRVVLAGGGTAGHTSPLIATAEAIRQLYPSSQVSCIGTIKGLETSVIPAAGLELDLIDPVPLSRTISPSLVSLPVRLAKSIRQARAILRQRQADVVVGFGGYVSLPVYFAAKTMGVPIVIHEQNALPGLANRVGARFAKIVATTFSNTALPGATCIGLPLRQAIVDLARAGRETLAADVRDEFGLNLNRPTLLVSGGSQGARSINTAVTGARDVLLAAGIQILHVWGPKNFTDDLVTIIDPQTGARYVPVRFVDHMERAYASADLMLSRAGAGTVVETAALGLPAIVVPFPSGNGEQALNAKSLVEIGAQVLVPDQELDADRVVTEVLAILKDHERLVSMSKAGQKRMPIDSATHLAELVASCAKGDQ